MKIVDGAALKLCVCLTAVALWFVCPANYRDCVFAKQPPEKSPTNAKTVKPIGFKPIQESKESTKGKRLFQKNHCTSCHTTGSSGGCLGPVLSGVGARRTKEFLNARITSDPKEVAKFQKLYGAGELLPHPRVSSSISKSIVEYLLTLPEPKKGFSVSMHSEQTATTAASKTSSTAAAADSVKEGKKLVYEKGCISCHSVGGVGGQFAVAFDGIGLRRTRDFVVDRISRTEGLIVTDLDEYGMRGASMPPLNLRESEIQSIVDYLLTLKSEKSTKNK